MSIWTQRTYCEAVVGPVVVADGGGAVATEVQGLVRGEEHGHGVLDATLADLVAVDAKSVTSPPFAKPPPS